METVPKKKRSRRRPGGQPGNTNARKHGFYSDTLTPAEHENYLVLTGVQDLDSEMAVFHAKYRTIFENGSLTPQAIEAASKYLAGYYRKKFNLNKSDTGDVRDVVAKILEYHAAILTLQPGSFGLENE